MCSLFKSQSFLALMFVTFLSVQIFVGQVHAEISTEQQEADNLARQGKVDSAIDAYRQMLKTNNFSSDLYYNLGTLELQKQNIGPGIWYLMSALSLDSSNQDAFEQLNHAFIELEERSGQMIQLPLSFRLQTVFNPSLTLLLILLLSVVTILILILESFRRKKYTAFFFLPVIVLILLAFVRKEADSTKWDDFWVIQDDAKVRQYPKEDAKVLMTAAQGTFGYKTKEEGQFLCLRLLSGADICLDGKKVKQVSSF